MRFSAALPVATAAVLIGMVGCSPRVPATYSPSLALTVPGAVEVGEFKYLPAIRKEVAPNQIANTAIIGNIALDQDISKFFRDAVFLELRFTGVNVTSGRRRLTGEIEQFLADDLGFNVDWTLKVRYVVIDTVTGATLYESEKATTNRVAKFVNVLIAPNEISKENIGLLLEDPAFVKAINPALPAARPGTLDLHTL